MYAFRLAFWVEVLTQFRGRTQSSFIVQFVEQTTRQHNIINTMRDVYFVLVWRQYRFTVGITKRQIPLHNLVLSRHWVHRKWHPKLWWQHLQVKAFPDSFSYSGRWSGRIWHLACCTGCSAAVWNAVLLVGAAWLSPWQPVALRFSLSVFFWAICRKRQDQIWWIWWIIW